VFRSFYLLTRRGTIRRPVSSGRSKTAIASRCSTAARSRRRARARQPPELDAPRLAGRRQRAARDPPRGERRLLRALPRYKGNKCTRRSSCAVAAGP
jgi:hypothetical protein